MSSSGARAGLAEDSRDHMDSGLRAGGQANREVEEPWPLRRGAARRDAERDGEGPSYCKPPSTIVGGVLLGPSAKVAQAGDSTLEMVHEG